MKDIYELLNEVQIDEEEIKALEEEKLEVTELEKERVKKYLKKAAGKKSIWQNKGLAAAVLAGLIIGAPLCVGITAPAYAAQLPIVGDIFRFLDNGRTGVYDLYKENANEMNVTKESKGISITLKDAVFDGKTITYTYEIVTDKNLGESPYFGPGASLKIKGYHNGLTGSSYVKKISEGTYIGQDSYSIYEKKDAVKCSLHIKEIFAAERNEKIRGDWQFDFQLKAVQGARQNVNKSTEKEGFTVTINSINKTPMSFIIDFKQQVPEAYRTEWDSVMTSLEVKDDLGNVYKGEDNGGSGNVNTGVMNCSKTFGKLNEKAAKLIITPKIRCSTNGGGVSIDEDGKETEIKPVNPKEDRELLMDDIIIELK